MTTTTAAPTEAPRRVVARDDIAPSGKQRAYIARLCLELLGVPYPASRRDAAELIDRLRERIAAAGATPADDIPL